MDPRRRLLQLTEAAVLALLVGATTAAAVGPAAIGSVEPVRERSADAPSSMADRRAHPSVRLRLAGKVSDQVAPVARVRVTSARRLPPGVVVVRTKMRVLATVATKPRQVVDVRVALPTFRAGSHHVRAVFKSRGGRASSKMVRIDAKSGCAWRPSSCGYPDARNTGPSGRLQRIPEDVRRGPGWHYDRGRVQIDGRGAMFEGYRLSGGIDITASNVTVRNNVVRAPVDWPIALRHVDGVVIADNSIGGTAPDRICDNAIRDIYGDSDGVRITGNDISWCSSGLNHFNRGGLIRGNYIHDLGYECPAGESDCGHFNGIQLGAGLGPRMIIARNTIFLAHDSTDAIMLANDDGPQANRIIRDNLLAGGGYTFYGSGGPGGEATGIVFTGNRFSTLYFPRSGYWGPVAHWQRAAGNVWERNVWDDGPRADREVRP